MQKNNADRQHFSKADKKAIKKNIRTGGPKENNLFNLLKGM